MTKKPTIGKGNVVIGKLRRSIGDGNVIATEGDETGSVILTTPMTVGAGARGGPGSIVIGEGAGPRGRDDDED